MSKPGKLQQNSPMPLKTPKKKGTGDERTEAVKNGSTLVGQPELTGKNNAEKQKAKQHNERDNQPGPYTD